MAKITLADLVSEVGDFVPGISTARIARAGNTAAERMAVQTSRIARSTFTTTDPVTTGTVAATAGSTAITGTGTAFAATDVGQVIQVSGSDQWYTIATRTSTTELTLSSAFDGDTDTGLTYTIGYPFVTLDAEAQLVVNILDPRRGGALMERVTDEHEGLLYGRTVNLGNPNQWALAELASTGASAIQLLGYIPNEAVTYTYTYRIVPAQFSAGDTTSTVDVPPSYDYALIAGVLADIYAQKEGSSDTKTLFWEARFNQALRKLNAEQHQGYKGERRPYIYRRRRRTLWREDPTEA